MNSHITFYYILKLTTGLMSLLTIILFVKFAGKEIYGQYSLMVSIIFVLNNLFSGWINQIIIKFLNIKKKNKMLKKIVTYFILLSMSSGLIVSMFIAQENYRLLLIIFFLIIFIYSIANAILQKEYAFNKIFFLETIRILILFLVPLSFIFIFEKVLTLEFLFVAAISSYMIPLIIGSIINFKILQNEFSLTHKKVNTKLLKIYMMYGIPIGLWLAVATMLNLSDRYIIQYYYSLTEVGIYSSIYDITYKICTFGLSPILVAIHPLVMNEYNQKTNNVTPIIQKALKLELKIFPILMLIIVGLSFFSYKTINIHQNIFLIIAIPVLVGAFFWNFSMILHKPLEIKNYTLQMLVYISISLIVNIVANFIFIPSYGYVAAAYTTILSFLIYIVLVYRKLRNV